MSPGPLASFLAERIFLPSRYRYRRPRRLEHGEGGLDGAIARFKEAMAGKHSDVIGTALAILLKRFCDPEPDEGYLREGSVAAARFEIEGDNEDPDIREQRALRQRTVNDVVSRLLAGLGVGG